MINKNSNENKRHNLVIMSWHNYDARIETLFGVPELISNGVSVEYWDVSALTIPGYHVSPRECPPGLVTKFIENTDHFLGEIKSHNNTVYIVFMTLCYQSLLCYHLLSKEKCMVVYCINGCLPSIKTDKNGIKQVAGRLKLLGSIRKIKSYLRGRVVRLLAMSDYIAPVDYILSTCSVANPNDNCKYDKNTRFVHFNSGDYQSYLNENKRTDRIIKNDYIVFIDQNVPFHPDNKLIHANYDPSTYFEDMNRIFKNIEEKTGLKVVIAAHPSCSAKYIENDYFQGRQVFTGITSSLVHFSKGVISHDSTAISFPVSFMKPIIFVVTDMMRASNENSFLYCKRMSSLLNCPFIGFDNNFSIPEKWSVDEDSYSQYKYLYLTNPDVANKDNWQIIYETIV